VAGLYRARIRQMARGIAGRDPAGRRLLAQLGVAFLPAAVLGPLLDDRIEAHLFRTGPVLAALFLGGLWMLWLGRRGPDGGRRLEDLGTRTALAIGLLQCVALWPGTSRSMMTIAGGVLLGLRARDAAEFSFLLGLPTLGGACVFKVAKDLWEAEQGLGRSLLEELGAAPIALGFAVSALSAAVAVRWLVAFLGRHGLAPFGCYRIALAGVLGVIAWTGLVRLD
jgi:undecaprenyl-diphosphatase